MLPEGTVSFLLTDVEGSTRLWQSAPEAMTAAIARHYELLDESISKHGGHRPQEQGEGDSIVAVFTDVRDAVAAAVDAQRAFAVEEFPGSLELRVRMAVHAGPAVKRDTSNYVGSTIIRCARLRACGHGGQILLSGAAAALARDRMSDEVTFVSLGTHRLKDLDAPEHVFQVVATGLMTSFPPLRSLEADKHNLPVQPTPLIGRDDEMRRITALLAGHRAVTLTGAGGVGKTRLAMQIAAENVDRYEGGAWWVDLATISESDGVAAAVLSAVGGAQQPFATVLDQLVTVLEPEASVLILLDNCEHVVDGCAAVVDALQTRCAGVRVLSTSREPLGVAGEATWRVASLAVPAEDEVVGIGDVGRFESITLFWDRALRASPQLTVTDDLIAASTRICRRVDGIPLAIELVAAQCRHLSPARIARELDEHYRLVSGAERSRLPRQRTLEASVEWSHRLLSDDEQRVLRRLAVFVGWFPLGAAEGVVSSFGDFDPWSVVELVGHLVDKSLLVVDVETDPGEPRYRMLETVRFFALGKATEAGELEQLRDAHSEWWAGWARSLGVGIWVQPEHIGAIDAVYPNLRSALQWSSSKPDRAVSLVSALALWMGIRGQAEDFRGLLVPISTALHQDRHPAWVPTAACMSVTAAVVGAGEFLVDTVAQALSVAEQQGDHESATAALAGLAFLDATAQSWARLEDLGSRCTDRRYAHIGGIAHHALMPGSLHDACDHVRAHVAEIRRKRDLVTAPSALSSLGAVLLVLGDLEGVRELCDEQRLLVGETGAADVSRLWHLAVDAAAALYRADADRISVIQRERNVRVLRGVPLFWAGPWDGVIDIAAHYLAKVPVDTAKLDVVAASPFPPTPWHEAHVLVGRELLDRRAIDPARVLAENLAASPLAERPYLQMLCGAMRARIAEVEGDHLTEETEWRALLALAVEQEAKPMAIEALEGIAVNMVIREPLRSMQLLAASEAARASIGYRFRFPREQERVNEAIATASDALGEEDLAAARSRGALMPLAVAAGFA